MVSDGREELDDYRRCMDDFKRSLDFHARGGRRGRR